MAVEQVQQKEFQSTAASANDGLGRRESETQRKNEKKGETITRKETSRNINHFETHW